MSKIYYQLLGAVEQKVAIVPLKIDLAGDASVDSYVGKGVASVTKSGTGEYTIVLKDNYNKLLSCSVDQSEAVADVTAYRKSEDVASKSIVIATHDGSVDADTAVAHVLDITLIVTKSSVA